MKHENYDLGFPDQPVVDLYLPIWAGLRAFQSKPAFIWCDDSSPARRTALTYQGLDSSVQYISSQLLSIHSLKRGDTVVILCAPGLEFVEIIFACQRAGLLAVPMTPPHPSFADASHLVRVLSQTQPKAALATRGYISRVWEYASSHSNRLSTLMQGLRWIPIEGFVGGKVDERNVVLPDKLSAPYRGCKANDVYLIQYTSGATGIPKPVLVAAGAAAHNVRIARRAYDLHPNSIIVSWLPQYHDCGLIFLLLTIVSGATCVLTSPTAFINRPRLWLELITEYKATCTPVPSFTLPLVVRRGGANQRAPPINLGSMKNLIIINEPLYKAPTEEFVRVFKAFGLNPTSISPSYGLAENCTFVSTAWRNGNHAGNFPIHNDLLPSAKLDGATQEDIMILVVNEETSEPVEDGTEGEIWISSPSNADGYLGHPSLTREVFNARLRNRATECFIRTGDRGVVMGHERYLYVTGRCSDLITHGSSSSCQTHPHYIETSAYNSCPEMLRAGCLAAFELLGSTAVVAELQKPVQDATILSKLCNGIRNAVVKERGVEVGLVLLVKSGSVPKTTSGKVQRWAAKIKVDRNEMKVVMRMEFGNDENCHEELEKKGSNLNEEGAFVAPLNTRNLGFLSSL